MLLVIVLVVLYNILMRYGFDAPPYWSDRIGAFANMSMILLGISLTVRNRELIAMQAFYEKVSPRLALALDAVWNFLTFLFALVFTWYGAEAALAMPGQYWDFQDFCIDLGGQSHVEGLGLAIVQVVEGMVGTAVRPLCVDGAVPQKYLAMLMPVSGALLVMASTAVLVEDVVRYHGLASGRREDYSNDSDHQRR